jgi:hypothetical protein
MAASSIRRIGLGVTIEARDSTSASLGSTAWFTIGNIVEPPSGPDATANVVDTHVIQDGTYETKRKGSVDPGTGSMTIAYDPEDDSGRKLADYLGADSCNTTPQWRITFPACAPSTSSVTETFSANVTGISRTMAKNELIQTTVTFQASGNPGYTTST